MQMLGAGAGAGEEAEWQALVASVNIGCYHVFGVPMCLVMDFNCCMGVKVVLCLRGNLMELDELGGNWCGKNQGR